MTDEVPDFSDDGRITAPMALFLLLEKVQRGDEPFTNLCEAYKMIFGSEPEISRPSQDLFDEISVALSAMSPSFQQPLPEAPQPESRRSTIDPPQRGPISNAVGLTGPSTVKPVPAHLMVPGVANARLAVDKPDKTKRHLLSTIGAMFLAYMVGVARGADDWGGTGRAVLFMISTICTLTVIGALLDRRSKR